MPCRSCTPHRITDVVARISRRRFRGILHYAYIKKPQGNSTSCSVFFIAQIPPKMIEEPRAGASCGFAAKISQILEATAS